MSRQICDRPTCTSPAVTFNADDEFLCANHAPADVEAHW